MSWPWILIFVSVGMIFGALLHRWYLARKRKQLSGGHYFE